MFRVFKVLARMRGLRGSVFDPFRYSADRRLDRALLADYQQLVERIARELNAGNYDTFLQLAELPSEVRGFGPVREQAAEAIQAKRQQLLKDLESGRPTLIRAKHADEEETHHV
jgi:indolepyruvate ferredoxin oxidoreductase